MVDVDACRQISRRASRSQHGCFAKPWDFPRSLRLRLGHTAVPTRESDPLLGTN